MVIDVIHNIEEYLPLYERADTGIVFLLSEGLTGFGIEAQIGDATQSDQPDGKNLDTAGFGYLSTNKQVEESAILQVTEYYVENGWFVTSVEEEKCGYDLICTKGEIVEHVEVKGAQGDTVSFIITIGELNQSRMDGIFILYVVTSALNSPKLHRFTAVEMNSLFDFEIVAYRAFLK